MVYNNVATQWHLKKSSTFKFSHNRAEKLDIKFTCCISKLQPSTVIFLSFLQYFTVNYIVIFYSARKERQEIGETLLENTVADGGYQFEGVK